MNPLIIGTLKMVMDELLKSILTEENKQKYGDRFFDLIEDAIADSETTIDDRFALPLVKRLRELTGIPDQPDETPPAA